MIIKLYKKIFFFLLERIFKEIKEDKYEIKKLKKEIYLGTFDSIYSDYAKDDMTASEMYDELVKKSISDKQYVYSSLLFRKLRQNKVREYIKLVNNLDKR